MINKLLILILVFPVLAFALNIEPTLTFSSATEVSPRKQISLYDIVEAKNLNDEVLDQLQKIIVADEKTTSISKQILAKSLHQVKAKFILPSEIKIVRSRNEVSRMEVERKIKNQIQMNCFNCDLTIQISSVPTNLPSDWGLDLNVDLNKSTAMIPIYSVSEADKKGWVVAQIRKFQLVPVLNRSVKAGEVLTKDFVVLEKRNLTLTRDAVMSIAAIEGMQTSRFINAGQTLTYSDLKKETLIKRGQMVKVLVGNESFEVSMSGLVEEAGALGDFIKVKNLDTQKIFSAKIVDRGIVRIE